MSFRLEREGGPEAYRVHASLKEKLAHVVWLGGSSCAGKSSIARLLATRHGLTTYHCDDHFAEHEKRLDPSRHPNFFRIKDLSPEELWMRPLNVQVAELSGFYDEEFEMVVEDLLSLSSCETVLVEGAGLAPRRVVELIRHPRQAVWLVTSAEFRRREYPRRGRFVGELLAQCSDREAAFDNWMRRDEERARLLRADLTALSLPYLEVDGRRTIVETADAVQRHFALGGAAPPPNRLVCKSSEASSRASGSSEADRPPPSTTPSDSGSSA